MEPSIDEITESLQKHAQIFDDLLRLIPPKFYLPEDDEAAGAAGGGRFMKNTKKATTAAQKDAQRKARASAKAARLDPDSNKTVQELQAEKLAKQEAARPKGSASASADDAMTASAAIDVDGEGADEAKQEAKQEAVTPMAGAGSIGELRQRLQERIQSLRQKRGAPEDDVSREALLEKRMKRRKSTKEATKQKQKSAKEQILGSKTPAADGSGGGGADSGAGSAAAKDHIFFGRLTTGMIKKKKVGNAKQQLEKVEQKKRELSELRAVDAGKADRLEEKDKWSKALDLAKGEKVRDDAKLLRKTIRRGEQQKKKSAREWADRKKEVATKIKERADRRDANIKARIDAKKMKKQGKSKKAIARTIKASKAATAGKSSGKSSGKTSGKSGKARPGFEGKAPR